MRDQAQLDRFAQGGSPSSSVFYDSAEDAARISIPGGQTSIQQVRFPLNVSGGSIVLTWDVKYDDSWLSADIPTHKLFQVRSDGSIWYETRSRYSIAPSGAVSLVDYRGYGVGRETGPADRLEPHVNGFAIQPFVWTRYWAVIEFNSSGEEVISAWVADENNDARLILDQSSMESRDFTNGVTTFDVEVNSSQDSRSTQHTLSAWVRNLVVLHNPASLPAMERPE